MHMNNNQTLYNWRESKERLLQVLDEELWDLDALFPYEENIEQKEGEVEDTNKDAKKKRKSKVREDVELEVDHERTRVQLPPPPVI